MKYASNKIKNLKDRFNIVDDFVEELKNDSLEKDKFQPSDRALKLCLKFV